MAEPELEPPAALTATVFEIAGRPVTVRDVVRAADARGALDDAKGRFVAGLEAEARAREAGEAPPDDAVEARANEIRYERNLITAEEAESWLSARGLTYDALLDHCRRELLREAEAAVADRARGLVPPEREADFLAYLVFSGELDGQARELARRLVVSDPDGDLSPDRLRSVEASYRRHLSALTAERERERVLALLRLPLTRVDVEVLDAPSLDAAREVVLCLRQDGADTAALAAETGYPHARASPFLDDLEDDVRDALLSAAPGDVLEPVEEPPRVRVFRLRSKREPTLEDPEVRERVDQRIVDAHFAERVARTVRWRLSDERNR